MDIKRIEFRELKEASGLNLTRFAAYFGIPYRTAQNWQNGVRECPQYLLELMHYKLVKEEVI